MKRLRNWLRGKSSTQSIEQQAAEAAQHAYPMFIDFLIQEMKDALDGEAFLEEVQRCPEQYRNILRNGWASISVWAFNQALSQSFNDHPEVAPATLRIVIEQVVAQKAWFDPHLCEAMQPHVDELMPDAWTSKEGRPMYPVAHWLEAISRGAQLSWSTGYLPDLKFGLFFMHYFPQLIIRVRDTTNRIMSTGTRLATPQTTADDSNRASIFKPDYGLFLATQGVTRDIDHFFYDFRLYEISVVSKGQYTTLVNLPAEGQVYAMSLDFDAMILQQILQRSPDQVRDLIERELAEDPTTPRTIELPQPIQVGMVARLGVKQAVAKEKFIPLIAQRLL